MRLSFTSDDGGGIRFHRVWVDLHEDTRGRAVLGEVRFGPSRVSESRQTMSLGAELAETELRINSFHLLGIVGARERCRLAPGEGGCMLAM